MHISLSEIIFVVVLSLDHIRWDLEVMFARMRSFDTCQQISLTLLPHSITRTKHFSETFFLHVDRYDRHTTGQQRAKRRGRKERLDILCVYVCVWCARASVCLSVCVHVFKF